MTTEPLARFDDRFSDPESGPTPWPDVAQALEQAELYSAKGLDVVVEGTAVRLGERDELQRIADAYEAKYGSVWHFDIGDGGFGGGELAAAVFRIEPAKVMAFAKEPHGQTSYRFGDYS